MNPQANQTPGLGLPQPSFDAGQVPAMPAQNSFQAPSQPYAAPYGAAPAMPAIQQPATPVAAQPQPLPPMGQEQPVAAAAPSPLPGMQNPVAQDMPAPAEEESSLDEEWVNKARDIVERTHNDPFLQSREISKLKAQYIKVRYNKDIKSSDDQP